VHFAQLAADFGFDFDLEGGRYIAAEADLFADISPLGLRGGGFALRSRCIVPATDQHENYAQDDATAKESGDGGKHGVERAAIIALIEAGRQL
jgi:hypothetical protein